MNGPGIAIASTHGAIGGGEVMLLSIAEALTDRGTDVLVLAPASPPALVQEARSRGLRVRALPGRSRAASLLALSCWRLLHPRSVLWCNGLAPSLATAGIGPRIVHLHNLPRGRQRAALAAARIGARVVLVPSRFLAARVPGSRVLVNWTEKIDQVPAPLGRVPGAVRIGFLGRITRDKGVHVLAAALRELRSSLPGTDLRLVLAGESLFGGPGDEEAIDAALAPIAEALEHRGPMRRVDFFAQVDLAVFPSVWEEPFGLVVAEAMAAGVPFVITAAGAMPEVAGPHHPWIAQPDDSHDLARVLRTALEASSAQRDAARRAARDRWEDEFSPQRGRERVCRLLGDLDLTAAVEPDPGVSR